MTFIIKPKRFKPIKSRCWEREFGSEFSRWEWNILNNFNRARRSEYVTVSGAVINNHRLGRNRFLLIPAPHLPQDQMLCICPDQFIPANNSYVTVQGKNRWDRDHYEIVVDDIQLENMKIPSKPEIDFGDFQDLLFIQWAGLEKHIADLLSFQFVSCPPLFTLDQAGGLVISSYDGTQHKQGKMLLRYFKDLLPREILLGKPCQVDVPWMGIRLRTLPFSWQYKTVDADKPLSPLFLKFMSDRKSAFSEFSIGVGTSKENPASIYDPPLYYSDQPTLLPQTLEKRQINIDPPLEIVKYISTQQLFFPIAGETKDDFRCLQNNASAKLVKVAESYDAQQLIRRRGILDPSYYGKSQSILRIALSSARALSQPRIDEAWVSKAFDEYCLKNYMWVLETAPDIFTSKGVETVSLKHEIDKQILRFITDTETRDTGVGFHLIFEHFVSSTEIELRESISRLLDAGKIYEPSRDVFRSIGLD